ncbi:MAG TPA: alkaline phosphatase family protein [Thermoanaerobaculia bacterium]|nr:alkaline phosphatase family protein [Thermoanaerobaculia bacterium]
MATSPITNVFVIMLENHSFDHLLGFSGITGTDAVTGQPTSINGLSNQSNSYNGQTCTVSQPAVDPMVVDPGHEFLDVLMQLCGTGATYPWAGNYPPICTNANPPVCNSGFLADWLTSPSSGEGNPPPGHACDIMTACSPAQTPVLNFLATEFAVCDSWFSSMPGPTWPNRFFAHGASSSGLDHSPSTDEIATWETVAGFKFPNGSIFDAINGLSDGSFRLYFNSVYGSTFPFKTWLPGVPLGNLPTVAALHNISLTQVVPFSVFPQDLANGYPYMYTYIEASYGAVAAGTYVGGNSDHPIDTVANGEAFLSTFYNTLRASSIWDTSLLIITWDEHGGYYDHVPPPAAVPPGDTTPSHSNSYYEYGFTFAQYGVRVPAVVVSPLIPQNLIDHRTYDHSSIPAAVESIFGLSALTKRDAAANDPSKLASLTTARSTPATTPNPPASAPAPAGAAATRPLNESIQNGDLPGFLYIAMREHARVTSESEAKARIATVRTRQDAINYLNEVTEKVKLARG